MLSPKWRAIIVLLFLSSPWQPKQQALGFHATPICRRYPLRFIASRPPRFPVTTRPCPTQNTSRHPVKRKVREWDGDDIRWLQRIRRRIYRSGIGAPTTPARTSLIAINFLMFLYQTVSTVNMIRRRNPQYWPGDAISIISDTLLGATNVWGPLTTDFIHNRYHSLRQPHRFLTAGFLHGNILHLLLNLYSLRGLPSWLETGLGTPLFLTTFLVSIITGNSWHSMNSSRSYCLGASGGICGIYGLEFVSLLKMGQPQKAMSVAKSMLLLVVFGSFLPTVSNAAHVGGFVGGVIMGILCAPNYQKSYSLRRKWSLEVDLAPREYRQVMGFGFVPGHHGLIPVWVLWALGSIAFVLEPKLRSIPMNILQGLLKPGSLSYF